jgi:type I restriction enzyme S subunit
MNEWKIQALPDLFDVQIGGTPSRSVKEYWSERNHPNSIPWVSIADMFNNRTIFNTKEKITFDGLTNSNTKIIPKGTLLFSFKLTIGRLAFSGVELTTNEAIAALIPKNEFVEPLFIYYVLPQVFESIVYDTAVKGKTLNKQKISKIKFFIPISRAEQQKIARILSTVDAVIEKTEAAIAKYKAIKAGMMNDLFTRGIDDNGQLRPTYEDSPERYKQTVLGWIPKEWEIEEMDNISLLMTNGFVGVATPFYANENGVIYLYGNNIRKNKIDLNKTEKIKIEFHNKLKKSQLRPDDMLTVQSGHIGTSAIVPYDFPVANCHALIITRFKNDVVIPSYISYYINSELGMRRMESIFVGSTIKHVNVKEFKAHSIPLASLKEQAAISFRIDSAFKKIQTEQNTLKKYQKIKQGLMQDLLTGKVKVSIDSTH